MKINSKLIINGLISVQLIIFIAHPKIFVESERVLSITGNIVTKTRNQLDEDTVNILVFI